MYVKSKNKVFWAAVIHPFNSPLPYAQKQKFFHNQIIKETWKYAQATVHSHSANAPFGSPNTVYLARSCRRSIHIYIRYSIAVD